MTAPAASAPTHVAPQIKVLESLTVLGETLPADLDIKNPMTTMIQKVVAVVDGYYIDNNGYGHLTGKVSLANYEKIKAKNLRKCQGTLVIYSDNFQGGYYEGFRNPVSFNGSFFLKMSV